MHHNGLFPSLKILYDDVGYFLEDKEAVAAVFAKSMTENKVRECLAFHWLNA